MSAQASMFDNENDFDDNDNHDDTEEEYTLPYLDAFFVEWIIDRSGTDVSMDDYTVRSVNSVLENNLALMFPHTKDIEVETTVTPDRACFGVMVYAYFNQDFMGKIQKIAKAIAVGLDTETVTYSVMNDSPSMAVDITYVEMNPHLSEATCTFGG